MAGKNAPDFALAYYLGQAVQTHPGNCFQRVSKDQGDDALIDHLLTRHQLIERHPDTSTRTFGPPRPAAAPPKAAPPKPHAKPDLFAETLQHQRSRGDKVPKTRAKRVSDLKARFNKDATAAQIEKVVSKLAKDSRVSFDEARKTADHLASSPQSPT